MKRQTLLTATLIVFAILIGTLFAASPSMAASRSGASVKFVEQHIQGMHQAIPTACQGVLLTTYTGHQRCIESSQTGVNQLGVVSAQNLTNGYLAYLNTSQGVFTVPDGQVRVFKPSVEVYDIYFQ